MEFFHKYQEIDAKREKTLKIALKITEDKIYCAECLKPNPCNKSKKFAVKHEKMLIITLKIALKILNTSKITEDKIYHVMQNFGTENLFSECQRNRRRTRKAANNCIKYR